MGWSRPANLPNRPKSPALFSPSLTGRPKAAWWWRFRANSACRSATSAWANSWTTCCRSSPRTSWHPCSINVHMNHLEEALDLAARGWGATSPNPAVGAVVVRDGEVVGRGYHTWAGLKHAEVLALDEARDRARGATLY